MSELAEKEEQEGLCALLRGSCVHLGETRLAVHPFVELLQTHTP